MANKAITLVRLCKVKGVWRRLPVAMHANGKIRFEWAILNGIHVPAPDGRYQLRKYVGTKNVFENIDAEDATGVQEAFNRAKHLITAKASAKEAGVAIVGETVARVNLQQKKEEFKDHHLAQGQNESAVTTLKAIDDFLKATKVVYADQITEASITQFHKYLRTTAGNIDRTVYNKHVSLFSWFKWLKIDRKTLWPHKPPKYTEAEVETYSQDQLKALFKACENDQYQTVVFNLLLKTGLREQEAMHLNWSNIDFGAKAIKVREDRKVGKRIKDRSERSVPMSDDLHAMLKAWRESNPKTRLVIGTSNDRPNLKLLRMLKRLANNAGLQCGACNGCETTKECYEWYLHRFRATYTTTLLRNGVDIRTVMEYTGHADMETVMRYLSPAESSVMQSKISSIAWM
jgi:integrase